MGSQFSTYCSTPCSVMSHRADWPHILLLIKIACYCSRWFAAHQNCTSKTQDPQRQFHISVNLHPFASASLIESVCTASTLFLQLSILSSSSERRQAARWFLWSQLMRQQLKGIEEKRCCSISKDFSTVSGSTNIWDFSPFLVDFGRFHALLRGSSNMQTAICHFRWR
jgi:hypothetical protein